MSEHMWVVLRTGEGTPFCCDGQGGAKLNIDAGRWQRGRRQVEEVSSWGLCFICGCGSDTVFRGVGTGENSHVENGEIGPLEEPLSCTGPTEVEGPLNHVPYPCRTFSWDAPHPKIGRAVVNSYRRGCQRKENAV